MSSVVLRIGCPAPNAVCGHRRSHVCDDPITYLRHINLNNCQSCVGLHEPSPGSTRPRPDRRWAVAVRRGTSYCDGPASIRRQPSVGPPLTRRRFILTPVYYIHMRRGDVISPNHHPGGISALEEEGEATQWRSGTMIFSGKIDTIKYISAGTSSVIGMPPEQWINPAGHDFL